MFEREAAHGYQINAFGFLRKHEKPFALIVNVNGDPQWLI